MLWFDRAGLDGDVYTELAQHLGIRRPRVLAWAQGPQGLVAALPDRLALRSEGGWQSFAWSDVERGGWDATEGALHWTLADGTQGGATLEDPGALPDLFRERVTASIVVNHPLEGIELRGTTIVARRAVGKPSGELEWRIVPPQGRRLSPGAQAAAEQELARVRDEYDIA